MEILNLKLVLSFETGVTESGNSIFSNVTLSNLRHTLTAQELNQIALVFASLIDHPLYDVLAVYTHVVRNEAA